MRNPCVNACVCELSSGQWHREVRERLIPPEKAIVEAGEIPADILAEMQGMGLFGLTIPEAFGGAGMNVSQYVRTIHTISYAMPAFRSVMSINIGMFASALDRKSVV